MAPKGLMTYAFTHVGNFLLLLLLPLLCTPQIPCDWASGLGVGIWAMSLGFGPQDRDLGLEAGIWASRLRYEPEG